MTTTECDYYGVRGGKLEQSKACKKCEAFMPETFAGCTKATKILEATSVIVEKGETQKILGPIPSFSNQPVETGRTVNTTPTKTNTTKKKETVKIVKAGRLPRVPGVIDACCDWMNAGGIPEEIESHLATKYMEAGYPKDKAVSRAHSIYLGQLRERKRNAS